MVICICCHHLVDEVAASNMETSYGSAEGLLVGTIDVALVAKQLLPKIWGMELFI